MSVEGGYVLRFFFSFLHCSSQTPTQVFLVSLVNPLIEILPWDDFCFQLRWKNKIRFISLLEIIKLYSNHWISEQEE